MSTAKILLVEGRADEAFYSSICNRLGLLPHVKVAPPRNLGGSGNNKEGALNHLEVLINQLADGRVTNLAVVVDADHATLSLGYVRTVERVTEILARFNFSPRGNPLHRPGGILYDCPDYPSPFGLWVMPGDRQDGTLEDWVKNIIRAQDNTLLTAACSAVANVDNKRFKAIHTVKAEVATWLAWQAAPGRGLESSVKEELLDFQSAQFQLLSGWLNAVFH